MASVETRLRTHLRALQACDACPSMIGPVVTGRPVASLLDGKKVPLYGDGLNIRDWCFVDDNCEAVDLVLREGTIGEIYNIGAGNEITNKELTHRLLARVGADESMIEPVADRL